MSVERLLAGLLLSRLVWLGIGAILGAMLAR